MVATRLNGQGLRKIIAPLLIGSFFNDGTTVTGKK